MAQCCEDKSCEITALRAQHTRVLYVVLAINAVMFLVEGIAGWLGHSTSLLADGLDMLGDALVYAFSLYVVNRSLRWQAAGASIKGLFMLAFGVGVLVEATHKALVPVMPDAAIMGVIGVLALAANAACFGLLYRHHADNVNMSSTWLYSRNDLLANVGVLVAAWTGHAFGSRWPDIVVGAIIAGLFVGSAVHVLRDARRQRSLATSPLPRARPAQGAPIRLHIKGR